MAVMLNDEFSVAYKAQSAHGIPATQGAKSTWSWIRVTFPQDSAADEQEELAVSSGVIGAGDQVVPGRRAGSLSFQFNLGSQASDWDGTAPALTAINTLIKDFFGGYSTGSAPTADAIASADGNTWTTDAGTYVVGNAYGTKGEASGTVDAINWVESGTSGALTLFQTSRATPDADADVVHFANLYPSATQPTPITIRIVSDGASEDMRYVNCYPKSLKMSLTAAKGIIATMEFNYYGRHLANDGGLYATEEPQTLPPLMGQNHARILLAKDSIAALDSDTPLLHGLCGLDELEVEVLANIEVDPCHGSADGVSGCQLTDKVCNVSVFVPFDAANLTATETELASTDGSSGGYNNLRSKIEGLYESQTKISWSIEIGTTPGRLMAMRIGSGYISARPSVATVGKRVGYRLQLRSGPYTGDSVDTNAASKAFNLCFG